MPTDLITDAIKSSAGLLIIFAIASFVSIGVCARISAWLRWRAVNVRNGIRDLLLGGNDQLLQELYGHPLIHSVSTPGTSVLTFLTRRWPKFMDRAGSLPTSIPPHIFALALFDAAIPEAGNVKTISDLRDRIDKLPLTSPIRRPLLGLVTESDGDVNSARKNVEAWFTAAMDKVDVSYRRDLAKLALLVALITRFV